MVELQPATPQQLLKTVGDIRANSAPVFDLISSEFVKTNVEVILVPFLQIVNVGIRTSKFANIFKIARVISIFRCGSKSIINNFRPTSLLSVFSKILENILNSYSKRFKKSIA